jgi:hypothetical protein
MKRSRRHIKCVGGSIDTKSELFWYPEPFGIRRVEKNGDTKFFSIYLVAVLVSTTNLEKYTRADLLILRYQTSLCSIYLMYTYISYYRYICKRGYVGTHMCERARVAKPVPGRMECEKKL